MSFGRFGSLLCVAGPLGKSVQTQRNNNDRLSVLRRFSAAVSTSPSPSLSFFRSWPAHFRSLFLRSLVLLTPTLRPSTVLANRATSRHPKHIRHVSPTLSPLSSYHHKSQLYMSSHRKRRVSPEDALV